MLAVKEGKVLSQEFYESTKASYKSLFWDLFCALR